MEPRVFTSSLLVRLKGQEVLMPGSGYSLILGWKEMMLISLVELSGSDIMSNSINVRHADRLCRTAPYP